MKPSALTAKHKNEAEEILRQIQATNSPAQKMTLLERYRRLLESSTEDGILDGDSATREEEPQSSPATGSPSESVSLSKEDGTPNPYAFIDYREYLIAWIRHLKSARGISLKQFAHGIGMTPAVLVKNLKHWRPLDAETFRRLISNLNLGSKEIAFLEILWKISDTESAAERQVAFRQLQAFSQFRMAHPREYEAWTYLSKWYYVAIRELASAPDFRIDPLWIQRKLRKRISLIEVRQALRFLQVRGFIHILPDGAVESLQKEISCSGGIYRLALGQFHREMLTQAEEAIERVPSTERVLTGRTINVPSEKYEAVRKILEDAISQVSAACENVTADSTVYHIEFFAIPLTQKIDTKK